MIARRVVGPLCAFALGGALLAVAGAPAQADSDVLTIVTVPPTSGARVSAEGNFAVAGPKGIARLPVQNWDLINERFDVPETRVSEDRKVLIDRIVGSPSAGRGGRPVVVGLRTERLISWGFVDRGGQEIPVERVSLLEMRSNAGEIVRFSGDDLTRPHWLAAGRTQQTPKGLVNKEQYWNITRVVVEGAEVVNSSQQKFFPNDDQSWTISLLFYRVGVVGRDLLFGGLAGDGVELVMPDGELVKQPFDSEGVATFPSLPRGTYDVRVYGAGASFSRPMSISRDQLVDIEVITPLDIGLVVATLFLTALSLLVIGRRHRLPKLVRARKVEVTAGAALLVALAGGLATVPTAPARADTGADAPTYAYFYIWYQPTSWLRAKTDYPLLGRYDSDDPIVMERQVQTAQRAGLDGFIVSWKHTDALDPRLETLADIAGRSAFELSVVYQGLDFERNPLPTATVIRDLTWFADQYADNDVFRHFGKPVVAITGTELFDLEDLRRIKAAVGDRLALLATAKSPADYRRVAPILDGDAYYWSSAHPGPGWYTDRLTAISKAVHEDDGLWFAPAAVGFDARLIGGTQVVPREDGDTLRAAIAAARSSQPDALAVISWNEYSENSHVEPSEAYGTASLAALAQSLGGEVWVPAGTGTPSVDRREFGLTGWGALILLLLLFAVLNLAIILLRPLARRSASKHSAPRDDTLPRSNTTGVPR